MEPRKSTRLTNPSGSTSPTHACGNNSQVKCNMATTSSKLDVLPREILTMIAEECPDDATLASLARTCKNLKVPAQERLYRNVVSRGEITSAAFWAAGHGEVGILELLHSTASTFKVPDLKFDIRSRVYHAGVKHDFQASHSFAATDVQFTKSRCLTRPIDHRLTSDRPLMHHAAICGHMNVVGFLHLHGVDINLQDGRYHTPLFYAAMMPGFMDTIGYLRSLGADIDGVRPDGNTMLSYACRSGESCLALRLILAGANVHIQGTARKSRSVLHDLVDSLAFGMLYKSFKCTCTTDTIRIMLARGLSLDRRDIDGNTPLHMVFRVDQRNIYEYNEMTSLIAKLIAAGADVNAQNTKGMTPAMLGCTYVGAGSQRWDASDVRNGVDARIEVFQNGENRIDFGLRDSQGKTCLMQAISNNEDTRDLTCARALHKHGAEINSTFVEWVDETWFNGYTETYYRRVLNWIESGGDRGREIMNELREHMAHG